MRSDHIRHIATCILLILGVSAHAQPYLKEALAFTDHLIQAGKLEDAQYVIDRAIEAGQDVKELRHRQAKVYYLEGKYADADSLLQAANPTANTLKRQLKLRTGAPVVEPTKDLDDYDLALLQYMAYHTLQGHLDTVRQVMDGHDFKDDRMANVEFNLFLKAVNQQKVKTDKKPWVGGILSTFIPGTGRIYAGRSREGLTSVLPIVIYGSQAAEGFYFAGFTSPHFYGFSPIALVFYGANIAGSVRAVKRTNQQRIEQLHHEVFDLLDPLVLER